MMYKVFAGGTLIVAPLIVLAIQNALPASTPAASSVETVSPPPPVPVPVAPPATPSAPASFAPPDPAANSNPVFDAGQPSLDPSAGQVSAPGYNGAPPPGSPNAEP